MFTKFMQIEEKRRWEKRRVFGMLLIPERVLKTQSKPKFGENKQIQITNKRFAGWQIDLANIYFLIAAEFVIQSVGRRL